MNEQQIKTLFGLIEEWNSKINITAINGYEDFLVKHICDSELGEKYLEGTEILDIGSGAGFPALVFALNDKAKHITMTDSVGKKVNVINDIITRMDITNARAVHCRIEDLKEKEKYDTVTARAVAKLNVLAEYALPFVKTGGLFVAFKSIDTDDEIKEAATAIKTLGGKIEKIAGEDLTDGIKRRFVLIRKIKSCDKKYPRPKNLPRTSPL